MRNFLLLLLSLTSTLLFGQDTEKFKDKNTGESFFVLKSDMTTKHGEYKKFSYKNKLLIRGFYKQGRRDSIWECYDNDGVITLKYDFTKSELIFYKPNDIFKDKSYRRIESQDTTLSRPPIFLGGDQLILPALAMNLRYPGSARENGIMGKVFVSFTIDSYGKTSNYQVKTPLGYGLDEEAIRVLKLLPDNWLPGMFNGQAVAVETTLPISFLLK